MFSSPSKKSTITSFGPSNATCLIYTFKAGLLSLLAHDLKLQVSRFKITVDRFATTSSPWRQVTATVDATSLRTVSAISRGKEIRNLLSLSDCRDIDRNIARDVLQTAAFPVIHFQSDKILGNANNFKITGQLTLCNVTRTIIIPVKCLKGKYLAEIWLDQLDFKITPYSALMGALKVKPDILIRIEMDGKKGLPRPKPAHLAAAEARGGIR